MSRAQTDEIVFADGAAIRRRVLAGELSPLEALEAHLKRIAERNPDLNAVVTLDEEGARKRAHSLTEKLAEVRAAGGDPKRELGPLFGLPFLVKDVFHTAGLRTTYGSKYFAEHVPNKDSFVVRRLRAAGGVLLGKTNTPEFAFSHFTDNELFGPTRNPWNRERSPGGSSGGDAAALAAFFAPVAVGSDLGGSVRVPAHCCGVFSFRATPGRISGEGHSRIGTPAVGELVTPGIMTRTMDDLLLGLRAAEGYNYLDPNSRDYSNNPFPADLGQRALPDKLKVQWLDFAPQLEPPLDPLLCEGLAAAARVLAGKSGRCRPGVFRMTDALMPTLATLIGSGLAENIAETIPDYAPADPRLSITDYMQARAADLGGFLQATGMRMGVQVAANILFMECDLAVLPVLPFAAPPLRDANGQRPDSGDFLKHCLPNYLAVLGGLPALTVPIGTTAEGLPYAVQVVGRRDNDHLVLQAGFLLEREFPLDRGPTMT